MPDVTSGPTADPTVKIFIGPRPSEQTSPLTTGGLTASAETSTEPPVDDSASTGDTKDDVFSTPGASTGDTKDDVVSTLDGSASTNELGSGAPTKPTELLTVTTVGSANTNELDPGAPTNGAPTELLTVDPAGVASAAVSSVAALPTTIAGVLTTTDDTTPFPAKNSTTPAPRPGERCARRVLSGRALTPSLTGFVGGLLLLGLLFVALVLLYLGAFSHCPFGRRPRH